MLLVHAELHEGLPFLNSSTFMDNISRHSQWPEIIYIGNHRGICMGWESEPPSLRQWVSTRKGWLDLSRFVERSSGRVKASQGLVHKKRWKMIEWQVWFSISWWRKSWVGLWSTSYQIVVTFWVMTKRTSLWIQLAMAGWVCARGWEAEIHRRSLELLLHSVERSHLWWPGHVSDVSGCSPREVFSVFHIERRPCKRPRTHRRDYVSQI